MADSSISSDNLGESPAVELTGKIMIVAIIILFMVVVVCLFIHLYAKWFWWIIGNSTDPQSRRRRRRFIFAPGQDQPNHGAGRRGLDPFVLRSLPVLVFQSEEFKDGLECAVCLSEVVQGEKARLLPKCNHGFHVDCIDMWFQSHSTCPLCRNPIAPESSKSGTSSNDVQNALENSGSSEAENSADMSPIFPTNVLIWGNQTQVSSIGASLEENGSQPPCSSSSSVGITTTTTSSSSSNSIRHGMLVIDIPSEINSSSLSPSASRFAEDDLKSPMTGRLRSLKRLLSRDGRLNPFSPRSIDVEQAGGAES